MNYIEYIRDNKSKIKATCKTVSYEDVYKKSFEKVDNEDFQKALAEFKQKEVLRRSDIFEIVDNKDFNKAFFLILLWGGIFQSNLNWVIRSIKEDDSNKNRKSLLEKLLETYDLVNLGNTRSAFTKMIQNTADNNRIKGVNISFLTKILYFFDDTKQGEKALIFDKWSRLEHCALIASQNEDFSEYYSIKKSGKNNVTIEVAQGKDECALYEDYIKRMNDLDVPAGKLEEFLFGYKFGSKQDKECKDIDKENDRKDYSNPRRFVVNYLQNILGDSFGDTSSANKKGLTITNQKRSKNLMREKKKASDTSNHFLPKKNQNDNLLKWKWVTLNGEPFLLFAAERPNECYFCQLCYKYEDDVEKRNSFDINTLSDVQMILERFNKAHWYPRNTRARKTYKYVKYSGDNAKTDAITLYDDILSFIEKL